mmetsp:Transcript_17880/g.38632  ORF Transcript_17880/g.38632 Transcript_17880/m.38632 type:complete len:84 (+) Transcript_17880:94-345(+)
MRTKGPSEERGDQGRTSKEEAYAAEASGAAAGEDSIAPRNWTAVDERRRQHAATNGTNCRASHRHSINDGLIAKTPPSWERAR